jgi:hypothetical protein
MTANLQYGVGWGLNFRAKGLDRNWANNRLPQRVSDCPRVVTQRRRSSLPG